MEGGLRIASGRYGIVGDPVDLEFSEEVQVLIILLEDDLKHVTV